VSEQRSCEKGKVSLDSVWSSEAARLPKISIICWEQQSCDGSVGKVSLVVLEQRSCEETESEDVSESEIPR